VRIEVEIRDVRDRPRFFVAAIPDVGGHVDLHAAAARHARVLRLAPGQVVELFDGRTQLAEARIIHIDEHGLRCAVIAHGEASDESPRMVLVQVATKGATLDAIVRAATELGITEIRLATTTRSLPADRVIPRIERLSRVAQEAARQAKRASVPPIVPPAPLAEVAAEAEPESDRVVFWENAERSLPARLSGRGAWIVVGPEGGLAESEVSQLVTLGYLPVRLASTTLRVGTAAVAALAVTLDRLSANPRDHVR
jgi:16S rRNA (uracil1498-N3)-methyltransferase